DDLGRTTWGVARRARPVTAGGTAQGADRHGDLPGRDLQHSGAGDHRRALGTTVDAPEGAAALSPVATAVTASAAIVPTPAAAATAIVPGAGVIEAEVVATHVGVGVGHGHLACLCGWHQAAAARAAHHVPHQPLPGCDPGAERQAGCDAAHDSGA